MVSQGETEYKDLQDNLIMIETLDNRVPQDHSAVEGPSTPRGGRALVQK